MAPEVVGWIGFEPGFEVPGEGFGEGEGALVKGTYPVVQGLERNFVIAPPDPPEA